MDVALQRKNMVESQVRPSDVTDRRILAAMQVIPREAFVPAAAKSIAYLDTPLSVAPGRSLMPPRLLAKLLQLAAIEPGHKVLDIGAATGYSAALIAALGADVTLLESDPDLASAAKAALASLNGPAVNVVEGPLAAGVSDRAPFDVIVIQGAIEAVPAELSNQLREGGRLVAVLRNGRLSNAMAARRVGEQLDFINAFEAWAEPIPGFEKPRTFEF